MTKNKRITNENSVNIALNDLMSLEDDRQREEDDRIAFERAEEIRLREEEEKRALEEEAKGRQRQEQERLDNEQAQKEAHELKAREEAERQLKIKLEAQAKARADEAARMLDHELELKRIASQNRGVPSWIIAAMLTLVVGAGAVGTWFYMDSQSKAQRQLAIQKQRETEQLDRMQSDIANSQKFLKQTLEQLEQAKKDSDKLERELQNAKNKPEPAIEKPIRPIRNGRTGRNNQTKKPPVSNAKTPQKVSEIDDPLETNFSLDDEDKHKRKKHKNR